jgi:uncharacterized protein (DUF58 family)
MLKKLWKILSVVLVIALGSVAGVAVYAFYGPPPITFNVSTDKETYQLGEPVNITITLKNQAPWPITIIRSVWYDFHIEDEDGNDVYSPGFLYLLWDASITLSPFQVKTKRFTWKQIDNLHNGEITSGTYKIVFSSTWKTPKTFEYNGREYPIECEAIIIIQEG